MCDFWQRQHLKALAKALWHLQERPVQPWRSPTTHPSHKPREKPGPTRQEDWKDRANQSLRSSYLFCFVADSRGRCCCIYWRTGKQLGRSWSSSAPARFAAQANAMLLILGGGWPLERWNPMPPATSSVSAPSVLRRPCAALRRPLGRDAGGAC